MENLSICKKAVNLLAALSMVTLMNGCTFNNPFQTDTSAELEQMNLEPMVMKVGDFDDIELPMDMTWDNDNSMAIKTDSFEGGIFAYSGRVELASLKEFIISSMESKQWKLAGKADSENILLAFTKPNKTCMIVLSEGFGGKYGFTKATLHVTIDVAAASRLNPFGEPIKQ